MASVNLSVNDRHGGSADHARHDHLLVARYGAGDAYPGEAAEAEQLVRRCAACARLAHDIEALRLATAALPAPHRTRDFRLTHEQAAGLRGSPLRRLLRRLSAPGLAPLRPLAGVAVSIGLVLMVAGVALPTPAGQVFSTSDNALDLDASAPRGGAEAPGALAPEPTAPERASGEGDGLTAEPAGEAEADRLAVGLPAESAAPDGTRSLLIYSGLLIAILSFAALSVLMLARWRGTDPLLR